MVARKTPVTSTKRTRSRIELEPRNCDNCKTAFKPKREIQRFCSDSCRRIARNKSRRTKEGSTNCKYCNKEIVGRRSHAEFCSDKHRRLYARQTT